MRTHGNVYIGTCGFPISRSKYFTKFNTVELQETFYNVPDIDKLLRLKGEAPPHFRFNMKAWQAITHPPTMPTWRKSKVRIPKDKASKYGFLRPTKENFEAWDIIEKAAKALDADVVVVQLPSSFKCNDENIRNMREFLSTVSPRYRGIIGIEVRGEWRFKKHVLSNVLGDFSNVIHVVDPFKWLPVVRRDIIYFRLHGNTVREINYKYKYSEEDLLKIASIVREYTEREGRRRVYIMFNNIYMLNDALRLKTILQV